MKESIRIYKKDWEFLESKALKFRASDKFLVFALFSKRRTHWDIIEIQKNPITILEVEDGYTYFYPGMKELGFYPPRNSPKRFCGTFVVGEGLELGLVDAYWMGREQIDLRIKMEGDESGKLTYKAWAFLRKLNDICEVKVEVI